MWFVFLHFLLNSDLNFVLRWIKRFQDVSSYPGPERWSLNFLSCLCYNVTSSSSEDNALFSFVGFKDESWWAFFLLFKSFFFVLSFWVVDMFTLVLIFESSDLMLFALVPHLLVPHQHERFVNWCVHMYMSIE